MLEIRNIISLSKIKSGLNFGYGEFYKLDNRHVIISKLLRVIVVIL